MTLLLRTRVNKYVTNALHLIQNCNPLRERSESGMIRDQITRVKSYPLLCTHIRFKVLHKSIIERAQQNHNNRNACF